MATEAETLIEQFKAGMDPESAGAMAARMTAAEARVAELEGQREVPGDPVQIEQLTKRAEAAERERDALAKSLDKAKAAVSKLPVEAKLRNLAPLAEGKALDRDALKAALADADTVEIAFSDGKKEIKGLAPVAITGQVWRDHPIGLMLTEPVDIEGPTSGADYIIEGYALMLDGKLAAYTPRDTPLRIRTGQKARISDDIHF